jgi:hypothetical protein
VVVGTPLTAFRQVELRQDLGGGRWTALVTWVRADGARRGRRVAVEGLSGVWEIVASYDSLMDGAALAAQRGEGKEFQDRLDTVPGSW